MRIYKTIAVIMMLIMIFVSGCTNYFNDQSDINGHSAHKIDVVMPFFPNEYAEIDTDITNKYAIELLNNALEDYEKKHGVIINKISISASSYNDYSKKLVSLFIDEKQSPDIVLLSTDFVNPIETTPLKNNDLLSVQEYISDSSDIFKPLLTDYALPVLMQETIYQSREKIFSLPDGLFTKEYIPFREVIDSEKINIVNRPKQHPAYIRQYIAREIMENAIVSEKSFAIDKDVISKLITFTADVLNKDEAYRELQTNELLKSLLDIAYYVKHHPNEMYDLYVWDEHGSMFDFKGFEETGTMINDKQRIGYENYDHVILNTDHHLSAIYAYVPILSKGRQEVYDLLNNLVSKDKQVKIMQDNLNGKYFHTAVSKSALAEWCEINKEKMLLDSSYYDEMIAQLDNPQQTKIVSLGYVYKLMPIILEQAILYSRQSEKNIVPYIDYVEAKSNEYNLIYHEQ